MATMDDVAAETIARLRSHATTPEVSKLVADAFPYHGVPLSVSYAMANRIAAAAGVTDSFADTEPGRASDARSGSPCAPQGLANDVRPLPGAAVAASNPPRRA
jgi:hypothetical protein